MLLHHTMDNAQSTTKTKQQDTTHNTSTKQSSTHVSTAQSHTQPYHTTQLHRINIHSLHTTHQPSNRAISTEERQQRALQSQQQRSADLKYLYSQHNAEDDGTITKSANHSSKSNIQHTTSSTDTTNNKNDATKPIKVERTISHSTHSSSQSDSNTTDDEFVDGTELQRQNSNTSSGNKIEQVRKRRRRTAELNDKELWKCPNDGCTKVYKRTSTISVIAHKRNCTYRMSARVNQANQYAPVNPYAQMTVPYPGGYNLPYNPYVNPYNMPYPPLHMPFNAPPQFPLQAQQSYNSVQSTPQNQAQTNTIQLPALQPQTSSGRGTTPDTIQQPGAQTPKASTASPRFQSTANTQNQSLNPNTASPTGSTTVPTPQPYNPSQLYNMPQPPYGMFPMQQYTASPYGHMSPNQLPLPFIPPYPQFNIPSLSIPPMLPSSIALGNQTPIANNEPTQQQQTQSNNTTIQQSQQQKN